MDGARRWIRGVLLAVACASCGPEAAAPPDEEAHQALAHAATASEAPDVADSADTTELAARAEMLKPLTGDLDELVQRRYIRVLVPLSRSLYFLDRGQQFG